MDCVLPQYKETRPVSHTLSAPYCTYPMEGQGSKYWSATDLQLDGNQGHVDNTRLPKITFYSELEYGTRSHGGQLKRFKDMLKTNMRACDLPPNELENLTADKSCWQSSFKKQVYDFERRRILSLQDKRVQRKTGRQLSPDCGFSCDTCSRVCASRIGLISHQRTHLWSQIRRVDGAVHHTFRSGCSVILSGGE